jgi:hypothetical protein
MLLVDIDDPYKHGAFLEKTDRFDKDKESDVTGEYTISDRICTNYICAMLRSVHNYGKTQISCPEDRTYE